MILRDELIAIGHYNRPHGLAGEISATVDVEIDTLRALSCLVTDIDGIYVPFFVTDCRPKSAETVLLTIDGIHDDKAAAKLVNRDIFALKREFRQESDEADADGYPIDFFVGFTMRDVDGNHVGMITDVDEQTENAIFIVDRDGEELMIPANDDLIVEFDIDKRLMVMDLPHGLLELND